MKGIASVLPALVFCAAVAPEALAQRGQLGAVSIRAVSCEGATCPQPLELIDGRPVTIRLSGSALGRLVSGEVVTVSPFGFVVEGTTVVLGRLRTAGRLTMRDATVTARAARPLGDDLRLRFTTDDGTRMTAPLDLVIAEVTTSEPVAVASDDPILPTRDPGAELLTVEESLERSTPRVTGADRTTVTLWAEGPSRTVVLEGSALDRVTGARVRHSGQDVPDVIAEVGSGGDPDRREISLHARESARVPWGEEMELVVEAPDPRLGLTGTYPTPVRVVASGTIPADHRHFVDAINEAGLLAGASASFNSCGPPASHRFSVAVPGLSHGRSGIVERFERVTSPAQRIQFLEDHSLDPSDVFNLEEFDDFGSTVHPSPIPHTVSHVRMCLANLESVSWRATGIDVTGDVPRLVVTVELGDARFRGRGMPASSPIGQFTGLQFGIGWGDPVTDRELPDRVYASGVYEVRLPMEVSDGRIRYGSPETTLAGRGPRWSGPFLGSSNVRSIMESFARRVMREQVGAEIRLPFEAQATRDAFAEATWSKLQAINVSEILGMQKGADGVLRFAYE